MARPLTKTEPDGARYARPPGVEAQIDEVGQLIRSDLHARLLITDRNDPRYLRQECLVHLVREGRRSGDQALMGTVLPVLLGRCEANLLVKVPDGAVPDAARLRQEILDELTDLFVMDGSGDRPDELDFYECKFNKAFRAMRIDAVRSDARRRRREGLAVELPPTESTGRPDSDEDAFARIAEAFRNPPTQEWAAFREPFVNAIEALPPDERDAVILVHILGYKEESDQRRQDQSDDRYRLR